MPWSAFLTGASGKDPGYDPLAFAVREAHARGLQLHAWFNPFRAMLPVFAGKAASNHVTRTHPEWIRRYGTQLWIDPGDPNARRAVLAAIVDVVKRYDVDGVHLDDYFYPYRESEHIKKRVHRHRVTITRDIQFPDDKTWRRYGKRTGWTDRNDWRRDNVNEFIHSLYTQVKAAKPWVLVGISPFGIWKSGTPAGITGLDAYSEIYADSRLWLMQGWLDYLAPQLYWPLDGAQNRFVELDHWWRESAQNPRGRYVWPGLATFSMQSGRWSSGEITSQITTLRDGRSGSVDMPGHVHFRMSALNGDGGLVGSGLRDGVYAQPALVPVFPWLGGKPPSAPNASAVGGRRYVVIPGDTVPVVWWLVQQRTSDGSWTTALRRASVGSDTLDVGAAVGGISVRGIGRSGEAGAFTLIGW